jgi:hypothetical protein
MNAPVNIANLHNAIKASLQDKYPDAKVDFYPRPGEKVDAPAILLDLEDIVAADPDEIGTDQLHATLNFNAYCVMSYKAGNKLALRSMAAAVLCYVRGQRWDLPVGAAAAAGAYPDQFGGDGKEYEVFRVEFSHEVLLGEDYWSGQGLAPSQVYGPEGKLV